MKALQPALQCGICSCFGWPLIVCKFGQFGWWFWWALYHSSRFLRLYFGSDTIHETKRNTTGSIQENFQPFQAENDVQVMGSFRVLWWNVSLPKFIRKGYNIRLRYKVITLKMHVINHKGAAGSDVKRCVAMRVGEVFIVIRGAVCCSISVAASGSARCLRFKRKELIHTKISEAAYVSKMLLNVIR